MRFVMPGNTPTGLLPASSPHVLAGRRARESREPPSAASAEPGAVARPAPGRGRPARGRGRGWYRLISPLAFVAVLPAARTPGGISPQKPPPPPEGWAAAG